MNSTLPVLRRLGLPVVVLLAVAAAWAWIGVDLRRQEAQHRADLEARGEAVAAAVEAAVVRECRGGAYDAEELAQALEDLRAGVEALGVEVRGSAGPLASAGEIDEGTDAGGAGAERRTFSRVFEPAQPRGQGRGRRGPGRAGLVELDDAPLEVRLALSTAPLAARLDADRRRALLSAVAVLVAAALVVAVHALLLRQARLAAELGASRERVRALEYLGRLGAGLAHETKNPLGVVRGFAERVAGMADAPDEARDSARTIVRETDRTLARLDEFLLLSRPAPGARRRFAVRPLLVELAELVRPELEARGARIDVEPGDLEVEADREALRRALLNLLLNAAQAVGEGGSVRAAARVEGGGGRIVIADDGPGVPPELRDTLFEPYVSGREGGTGLGLAIVRRACRAHGWEARLDGHAGPGATFVIEVPAR